MHAGNITISVYSVIVIIESNWFHGRVKIENANTLNLTEKIAQLNWTLAIPKLCLFELYSGLAETYRKSEMELNRGKLSFRKIGIEVESNHKDLETFANEYKKEIDSFISNSKVKLIDPPKNLPTIEELFEMAALKKPPFDETGNSYRDAMLALSIKEFAEANPSIDMYFHTKDKKLAQAVDSMKIPNIISVGNEASLFSKIDEKLADAYKKTESGLISSTLKILQSSMDTSEVFIKKNMTFNIDADILETLISIDDFKLKEIAEITSVSKLTEQKGNFSGLAVGELNYKVQTNENIKENRQEVLQNLALKKLGKFSTGFNSSAYTAGYSAGDSLSKILQKSEMFIETRKKLIAIDIEGEVTIKDGTVINANISRVENSEETPYRFYEISGKRREKSLPRI